MPPSPLDRFEEAWQSGTPPRLEEYVPPLAPGADAGARRQLLEELIQIDLEYRWRRGGSPPAARPRLEEYLARYRELGGAESLSATLIGWEYLIRRRYGDRPAAVEYATRFPRQATQLHDVLAKIDAQLAAEFADREAPDLRASPPDATVSILPPAGVAAAPVQSVTSTAALIEALSRHQLLTGAQLNDPLIAKAKGTAHALARELLQRNWLTPYQVNCLLQGRGGELLLGHYVLLERLGEGGVGQVFKARHQKMQRIAALKVLRHDLLTESEVVHRFYREMQVISQLDHPNVVHAYDAGPISLPSPLAGEGSGVRGTHMLVMEYVEGIDLNRLVKQKGPLPVDQAGDFIRQAALGLQHAHEKGLVHRDIKPSNLMVTSAASVVKVLDLGLARLRLSRETDQTRVLTETASGSTLTPEGAVLVMGTPDYLAPEQAVNFHGADIRADIYSLGCTFYYLLTGQPPFSGGTMAEKLWRHQQVDPPPLAEKRGDVPAPLAAVLYRMVAKRPEDRFQTPAEVALALAGQVAVAPAAEGRRVPAPTGTRQRSRWGRRVAVTLLLLMGVAVGGVFVAGSFGPGRPAPSVPSSAPVNSEPRVKHRWVYGREVHSVAAHPDGAAIVAGGPALGVFQWDPTTGKDRPRLPGNTTGGVVYSLTFAPGGQVMALISGTTPYKRSLKLWRVDGWKEQTHLDCPAVVRKAAFSPDGKILACALSDGTVCSWDWPTLKPRPTFTSVSLRKIEAIAFSPDSKTLAVSAFWYGNINGAKLLDAQTGEERLSLKGHDDEVLCAAFSPDGLWLATGSQDKNLKIWDAVKGTERITLRGHNGAILALAFAPDGQTVATASFDGTVKLWDVAKGTERTTLSSHTGTVHSLAYDPHGKWLATGSRDGTVLLWDLGK